MAATFLKKHKELLKGSKTFKQKCKDGEDWTNMKVQQSDYLKKFLESILKTGLKETYEKFGNNVPGAMPPKTTLPVGTAEYDVIIVGAGMAGLSAAYELKNAGCTVKILEQTTRYGGRVYTYHGGKLASGLYAEAGAMRLPGKHDDSCDRQHYLTDGYIEKFNLKIKPFPNADPNGLTYIYGLREKTSVWAEKHFDKVWPNWKLGIKGKAVYEINNIDQYYERTTAVVTNQLRKWLKECQNIEAEIIAWARWIDIWSQFTLESFLESNIDVIRAKVRGDAQEDLDMEALGNLLPWTNDAVRGYSVFSYTEQLDQSLVQYLRDQLGSWWSQHMHCLQGGMHQLPKAFFDGNGGLLSKSDIEYNKEVSKITYTYKEDSPNDDFVTVTCYPHNDEPVDYTAKAVIVTTPVNILRKITFKPTANDEETKIAWRKTQQAIEDIYVGPSTKIFLQTKTRFWEDPPYNIQGGFSKTNLPIGQIHYVKPEDSKGATEKEKGLLLIYTWKNEALSFGSMKREQVKKEVIEQVAEIHPEINEDENKVEHCIVHAWYNEPSYQGAYGLTKTTQFDNVRHLWEPMGNVHFANEALSFTTGWIQGALESGLKAAYQVYLRHPKMAQKPQA